MRLYWVILALVLFAVLPLRAETIGNTSVCFVPGPEDCAQVIVGEIATAQHTLEVQAYNFTEPHIIQAIIDAHGRGVEVKVILDKISPTQKGEGADPVHQAGIPTFIDYRPKIAHNKVMIIDGKTVISGSFNFSTNADLHNAENLLVLREPALAAAYAANFDRRLAVSEIYER